MDILYSIKENPILKKQKIQHGRTSMSDSNLYSRRSCCFLRSYVSNKYIDNKDDADDVLQIALENLIKKLDDLKKKEKHKRSSYILATCRNTSINFLKKCNRIQEYELQHYDGADYYSNPPEESIVRQEDYDILYAAWKSLDEKSRYFLEARYTLEKPIKEIVKDLGIQENNARAMLSRSRNKLKAKFDLKSKQSVSMR